MSRRKIVYLWPRPEPCRGYPSTLCIQISSAELKQCIGHRVPTWQAPTGPLAALTRAGEKPSARSQPNLHIEPVTPQSNDFGNVCFVIEGFYPTIFALKPDLPPAPMSFPSRHSTHTAYDGSRMSCFSRPKSGYRRLEPAKYINEKHLNTGYTAPIERTAPASGSHPFHCRLRSRSKMVRVVAPSIQLC